MMARLSQVLWKENISLISEVFPWKDSESR